MICILLFFARKKEKKTEEGKERGEKGKMKPEADFGQFIMAIWVLG